MPHTLSIGLTVTDPASLSRRNALKGLACSALGLALLAAGADRPVPAAATLPALRRSMFTGLIGEQIHALRDGSASVALRIDRLRPLSFPGSVPRANVMDEGRFSLLFSGALDHPLAQDVYRLAHPRLAELMLLITPLQPDAGLRWYEAVINSPEA